MVLKTINWQAATTLCEHLIARRGPPIRRAKRMGAAGCPRLALTLPQSVYHILMDQA
jgi:hypothetical protein